MCEHDGSRTCVRLVVVVGTGVTINLNVFRPPSFVVASLPNASHSCDLRDTGTRTFAMDHEPTNPRTLVFSVTTTTKPYCGCVHGLARR